jgi:hypothetical protein
MGFLENGAAGTVRGGAQKAGLCRKTNLRLAYRPGYRVSSCERLRLAFANQHFCAANHSRSSWRPPRRLHLEFGCYLPSCRILVPEGVHYHTNCRWPEWFQKPAAPGVDRERNYERPGSKRSTFAKFRRGTCATRRFAFGPKWAGSLLLLSAHVDDCSIAFSSLASRLSLVALTCLESGNGLPNALALLRTANIGRFNTTEARAGEAPPLISE